MTLLLRARLEKTKAVIYSEKPYWADPVLLDEEMKRRLEIKDKPREAHEKEIANSTAHF